MKNCGIPDDVSASQDLPSENPVVKKGTKSKSHKTTPCSLAVGRTLKRLRERKNLGQGEAALEANFSLSYLSNVERGIHSLSLSKFMSFAEGIDSSPKELCRLLCEEIAKVREENQNEEDTEADDGDRTEIQGQQAASDSSRDEQEDPADDNDD